MSKSDDLFDPVSEEAWRERVDAELAGQPFEKTLVSKTPEGFERWPLYTAADQPFPDPAGFPGRPPYSRGYRAVPRGWTVAVEHWDRPERPSEDMLQAIRTDLELGADWLWLGLDDPERLELCLWDVDLSRVAVGLDAGVSAPEAAEGLVQLAGQRGTPLEALTGTFGADPLAGVARESLAYGGEPGVDPAEVEDDWERTLEVVAWSRQEVPGMRALLVSTTPYHDAGASAVEELAFALATGVEALRRLAAAGLPVETAARSLHFSFRLGRDLFTEIAKLRAARGLWARAVKACGGSGAAQVTRLEVRGSTVTRTARDPWVNLLRGTVEGFAAAVGGADSLVVTPFDASLGRPDPVGRRAAINTQHVLLEEGHLARVADPVGGSWYVESLTDHLSRAAYLLFQYIERQNGMTESLLSGWVAERLAASVGERRGAVARRRDPFVGVSVYPDLDEELPDREPELPTRDSLSVLRFTWPFERLRQASDEYLARHGRRPCVLLAPYGEPSDYRARSGFATDFFAAGGIRTAEDGGAAGVGPDFDFAVLCSSDELYPEAVPKLAPELRRRGARRILLAGRPDDAWRDHVDHFIHQGCDAAGLLSVLLLAVGALKMPRLPGILEGTEEEEEEEEEDGPPEGEDHSS